MTNDTKQPGHAPPATSVPPDTKLAPAQTSLSKPQKIGIPKLHQRLQRQQSATADVSQLEHRIGLLLDVSGSMAGKKIQSLVEAMTGFINGCDFATTALAIETFGDDQPHKCPLMTHQSLLMATVMSLAAAGGTPMTQALTFVLGSYPVTRCVLVSDGQPDNDHTALDAAGQYAEAATPVDCVHIGNSDGGEALLRQIAEQTGGLFIKFKDVSQFANNFKYLTPGLRAFLTDGSATAALLGADEVK